MPPGDLSCRIDTSNSYKFHFTGLVLLTSNRLVTVKKSNVLDSIPTVIKMRIEIIITFNQHEEKILVLSGMGLSFLRYTARDNLLCTPCSSG